MRKKVAIVGMSFRLPGTGPDRFWPDLMAGKNLVSRVAADRWAQDSYLHPRKSHPGTSYTFAAGSIGDVFAFDAGFFGISPREAAQIDPQQRLLLELSWEALENAGIRPSAIRRSRCGVYIGNSTIDYSFRFADDPAAIDSSVATGTSSAIAANRISYAFDLCGPSLVVDTACSSSLVAFHLACRAIAFGEIEQALVGGVCLHTHPYAFISFSKASMLSRNGACSVFDRDADGYVRSEGAGVFVLKEYEQALADGDPVLAIVSGTAANADGRKAGLTVPSVDAQAALLRQAYAEAGIAPEEIDYIEAHGTGTAVGDPVETHAIGEALGRHRPADRPLLIGSVKSNIGHLEAAAGAAGLVKALGCIRHRVVPKVLHFENPNPNIRFDEWNLRVPTEAVSLKPSGRLVVGVNSFGFGGANAHVILESPDARAREERQAPAASLLPLAVSGRTPAAAGAAARELARFLRERGDLAWYDVAWTTTFRRDWHEHRAIVMADGAESAAAELEAFADGAIATGRLESGAALPPSAEIAFVYSGNGSQWAGMGRRLMEEDAAFREAVRAVDSSFRPLAGYSLEAEFASGNGADRLEFTEFAQPALFALQVGITESLRARGVVPAAVTGHSVGEVAAAWASGALSLEQAVQVIYYRSQSQAGTKGRGRMTAVNLNAAATGEWIARLDVSGTLSIAALNSSRGTTVAGQAGALNALEKALAREGISCRRLDVDYAFHSPAMDPIRAGLEKSLAGLRPGAADIPFYSTVTGSRIEGDELDANYWWRNIREPVQFEKAVKSAVSAGARVFVEIGPQPLLRGYVAGSLRDEGVAGRVVPTLLRNDDSASRIWNTLCQVAVAGAPVCWESVFARRGTVVPLPNYSWQRERYYHEVSAESYQRLHRRIEHPLLGYRLHESDWAWENRVDTQLFPTLADHVVGEAVVMPGAAYAEMALAAARLWHGRDQVEVEQLSIRAPLVLNDGQTKTLRFAIDPTDGSFTIRSRDRSAGEDWTLHAAGRISMEFQDVVARQAPLALPARPADVTAADHDARARALGLHYGPAYRAIESVWLDHGTACARFRVPGEIGPELAGFDLHPALLDCTFQLIIEILKDDYVAQSGLVYVPARIDGLHIHSGGAKPAFARASVLRFSAHSITASFTLYDERGEPVAWICEARFNSIRLNRSAAEQLSYLDYHCVPRPHPQSPVAAPVRLFEQLQKKLAEAAQDTERAESVKRYTSEIDPLLDALCSRFAARALEALSGGDGVLSREDVEACASQSPDSAPLLARLIEMLEEDKVIVATPAGWQFVAGDDRTQPEGIWNTLISDYPDYLPVFHGVGRVGMHLPELLSGQLRLEQVLPRECTPQRLMHHLLADAGLPAIHRAIHDLMARVIGHLPAGRRLRILELGAGDPLFAANLCRALDFDVCDYVYATGAPAVPEGCHRLKESFPAVEVRQAAFADQETAASPVEQFHFALVTSDFATEAEAGLALRWAKRHLAPGGALVLVEQHPSRWMDFLYGGRRGWWTDAPGGGWISRNRHSGHWRQQLQKMGLETGAILELGDDDYTGPFLLLAHDAHHPAGASRAAPVPARTWVLLADGEGFSADLAEQLTRTLEARGDRVARIAPGRQLVAVQPDRFQLNLADAAQIGEALRQIGATARIEGILHLHGLTATRASIPPLLVLERQADRCASAAALSRACEATGTKTTCWLVTARAGSIWLRDTVRRSRDTHLAQGVDAAFWGFGRTLMNESSTLGVRLVDVDDGAALPTIAFALAREILYPDGEQEVIFAASGDRYVPRLRVEATPAPAAAPTPRNSTWRLGFQSAGQLRNLRWESHPRARTGGDDVEVEVRATGLNFRDVMITLGLLSDEAVEGGFAGSSLGLELAGVVNSVGDRVRGFAPGDRVVGFAPMSFSNRVVTPAICLSPIPGGMSFEAAATIPSAFFTVHYAFNHLARLEQGEKVLIHGAAGGVGIAAIQMAKQCGAEIFATAGTDEKRDFLRLMGIEHIFDSRSYAFADEIMEITGGRGVDVLLNSLAGEAINRNLRVLKPFGRFLELGKRDFQENTRIGLRHFRNNISYFGVDVDQLMKERPDLTGNLFREMMLLFNDGVLRPLPYRSFEAEEVVDGFRYMQQSRHIGKIVVTYRNEVRALQAARPEAEAYELDADATYLVTGGLRGFGLKTAEWLAARGACNLVLVSRSGAIAPEAREVITKLEAEGVKVHAAACDVTDARALAALLSRIATVMPPLRGVVHAAAVIDDGLARNLDRGRIRQVLAPKVLGALNLHQLTLDKSLDFFILYSSATTLFGNPGQGSYVAANSALEAIAESRRASGLPALCVRWGAIDDVGYLARNAKVKDALQGRMGGSALPSSVALDALETLLLANRSGVAVLDLDWGALSRSLPTAASPKFSEIALRADSLAGGEEGAADLQRLLVTLSADELAKVIGDMLRKEIGGILRTAPEKIGENISLNEMGFDSLMKVELATAVEARFSVNLPAMALGEIDTVAKLVGRVIALLTGAGGESESVDDQARKIAAVYADETHVDTYVRTAEELQSGEPGAAVRMIE